MMSHSVSFMLGTLAASILAGVLWHFPTAWMMKRLWRRFYTIPGVKEATVQQEIFDAVQPFIILVGVLERVIYSSSWLLGAPEAIAIVLALKAAPSIKEWSEKKAIGRTMFNIWLSGNFLSVIGAILIAELFRAIFPNCFN